MNEEEVWDYGNYWEEGQLKKEENTDLYVLRLFYYACTVQFITLLTCKDHQKIIPKGGHFIKGGKCSIGEKLVKVVVPKLLNNKNKRAFVCSLPVVCTSLSKSR